MKPLIKLSYLGCGFCGYQAQKDKRTVQNELTIAAKKLFSHDCDITGCSRTDSGVHANCFCITITDKGCDFLTTTLQENRIMMALNSYLPNDISVFDVSFVENSFHPRYSVKYKEYIYKIYQGKKYSPFMEGRAMIYKKRFSPSDIERMNIAANYFVGEHDFSAFMAQGSKVVSTVRNVKYANVEMHGDEITFKVAADGFLYNMVRIMAGTLIAVGENKIDENSIPYIIESRERKNAGETAVSCGLYLNDVVY